MRSQRNRGFTLVEVMVAMAIVALSISALLFSVGKQVDNSAWLREKMFAQWVALNVLQEAQLIARVSEKFPEEKTSGDSKLGDIQWRWEMQSSKTADENILRLDVSVYSETGSDPVATSSGYVDNYYRQKTVDSQRDDSIGIGIGIDDSNKQNSNTLDNPSDIEQNVLENEAEQ